MLTILACISRKKYFCVVFDGLIVDVDWKFVEIWKSWFGSTENRAV